MSVSPTAEQIGAYDARHREHLVALARQLTSSASLKRQRRSVQGPLLLSGRFAARIGQRTTTRVNLCPGNIEIFNLQTAAG